MHRQPRTAAEGVPSEIRGRRTLSRPLNYMTRGARQSVQLGGTRQAPGSVHMGSGPPSRDTVLSSWGWRNVHQVVVTRHAELCKPPLLPGSATDLGHFVQYSLVDGLEAALHNCASRPRACTEVCNWPHSIGCDGPYPNINSRLCTTDSYSRLRALALDACLPSAKPPIESLKAAHLPQQACLPR